MALYKVIDDWLPQQVHDNIHNYLVYSGKTMWCFMPFQTSVDYMGKEQCQFVIPIQESVYGLEDPDNVYQPILDKIKAEAWIRMKLNCTLKTDNHMESAYHTDRGFACMTAIYYINTNNGYTQFEHDGSKVNSVANRIVMFPSNVKHRGVTTTNTPFRMVLNLNYHPS